MQRDIKNLISFEGQIILALKEGDTLGALTIIGRRAKETQGALKTPYGIENAEVYERRLKELQELAESIVALAVDPFSLVEKQVDIEEGLKNLK